MRLVVTILVLLLAACASPSPVPAPVMISPPAPMPAEPPAPPALPKASEQELLARYITQVRGKIRSQMQFKGKPASQSALFQISLAANLRIREVKLLESSRDAAFDRAVLRAIRKIEFYPELPEGLPFGLFASHKIRYRLHD